MDKRHFHDDGEPKNGIVASMLGQVAQAIACMKLNRDTTFRDFTDDQFNTVVEHVIFLMAANLGYKCSLLTMLAIEKYEELKQ